MGVPPASTFAPTDVQPEQWIQALVSAGVKRAVLVVWLVSDRTRSHLLHGPNQASHVLAPVVGTEGASQDTSFRAELATGIFPK